MYVEYLLFCFYAGLSFLISLILFVLSLTFITQKKKDVNQISAYECGFQPFSEATGKFDVRYYLVAILFILFDLETVLLFPWAVAFSLIGFKGYIVAFGFLLVLTVGFAYEWDSGALNWD